MCDTCLQHRQKKHAGEVLSAARRNARRMVNMGRIRSAEEEDFASELAVKLLKRLEKWDPSRLPVEVFIGWCLKRDSIGLLRTRRFQLSAFSKNVNLGGFIEEKSEAGLLNATRGDWEGLDQCAPALPDVTLDVWVILAECAEEERDFLYLLPERGFRNAASQSGMTRGNAERLLQRLRKALADHAPANPAESRPRGSDGPRNTR